MQVFKYNGPRAAKSEWLKQPINRSSSSALKMQRSRVGLKEVIFNGPVCAKIALKAVAIG
jgi:hypothetical protein